MSDKGSETVAERGPGFRTIVAAMIAVISVLGAIAAWRAAVVSITAADLNEDGMLELVQREQIRAQMESLVDEDVRLFAEYRTHVVAWDLLLKDAKAQRQRRPELADALEAQAQGELARARALVPFFRASAPALSPDATYDRAFALSNLESLNTDFRELDPDASFARGAREYRRTVNLVLVVALFVASLFFLTLAQFARRQIRGIFAGAGGVVAVLALALFFVFGGI